MESLNVDLNLVVTVSGAVLGSIKASIELDKNKSCMYRFVDVLVGVYFGVTIAYHFHNANSVALTWLLSLVGGISGGVFLDVLLQMLPSIIRKVIKNWVDNKIRPQ